MVKQSTSEGVAPAAAAPATYPATSTTTTHAGYAPLRFGKATQGIRIVQLVLGLLVLALCAALAAGFRNTCALIDEYYGTCLATLAVPGIISYNIFVGVWTFLLCCYLIAAAFKPAIHQPIAVIVLDALSAVFWFSGFIALAVFTGVYSDYTGDDYSSGFGLLIATVIFAAANWALFTTTLTFTILNFKASQAGAATSHNTPMQQYPNQGIAQHA